MSGWVSGFSPSLVLITGAGFFIARTLHCQPPRPTRENPSQPADTLAIACRRINDFRREAGARELLRALDEGNRQCLSLGGPSAKRSHSKIAKPTATAAMASHVPSLSIAFSAPVF